MKLICALVTISSIAQEDPIFRSRSVAHLSCDILGTASCMRGVQDPVSRLSRVSHPKLRQVDEHGKMWLSTEFPANCSTFLPLQTTRAWHHRCTLQIHLFVHFSLPLERPATHGEWRLSTTPTPKILPYFPTPHTFPIPQSSSSPQQTKKNLNDSYSASPSASSSSEYSSPSSSVSSTETHASASAPYAMG